MIRRWSRLKRGNRTRGRILALTLLLGGAAGIGHRAGILELLKIRTETRLEVGQEAMEPGPSSWQEGIRFRLKEKEVVLFRIREEWRESSSD